MTYLEAYLKEHPNEDPNRVVEKGCVTRYDTNFEEPDEKHCYTSSGCAFGDYRYCIACWNREMPEKKETPHPPTQAEKEDFWNEFGGPFMLENRDAVEKPTGPRVLDSGARRDFGTGAVRDIQEGKGRCDLMPLGAVAEYFAMSSNGKDASAVIGNIANFQETGNYVHLIYALGVFTEQHWGEGKTMLLETAKHFEDGARKYGEWNWQNGIPLKSYIDSAVRHYLKFLRGDQDEPHDRAFCWNLLCAIWTCRHKPEMNGYGRSEN